jgi:S1-C subfamily serine protease
MRRTCSLVIGCMILVTACGDDGPGAMTHPTTSSAPAPLDTDTAVAATVSVQAEGCGPRTRFGVGTVIDGGLIVTVAHVVAGSEEVEVVGTVEGSTAGSAADVVFFDPGLDIAVLRPTRPIGRAVELRASDVDADERAAVVLPRLGSPVGVLDVTIVRSVTIRTTDIYRETDLERPGFEVTATIEPGDSGAMVHTAEGGAGLIWARSNERVDRAWAVDLPLVLFDEQTRSALIEPVDVDRCVG